MIIYIHPIADNLPIKTLVARRLRTNKHIYIHTYMMIVHARYTFYVYTHSITISWDRF